MKQKNLHVRVYSFLATLLTPLVKYKFNYFYNDLSKEKGPYLVLSNHNLDLDAFLVGAAFKTHMYYVASEHIFRQGIWSRLLVKLFDPIPRIKGKTGTNTPSEIIKRLQNGHNVCMFAEGDRSFHGRTMPIRPSTGTLVKKAKATIITFRLKGGYFTQPRWGHGLRRGRMEGQLVSKYSPEQLSGMSIDEINTAIRNDLFEDAYESQKKKKIPFKGKNLALGLETFLFICPECHGCSTMKSSGNHLTCTCGLSLNYTEYGHLAGNRKTFKTISEWDKWQTDHLSSQLTTDEKSVFFYENDIKLLKITDHKVIEKYSGILSGDTQHFTCCDKEFIINKITNMAIYSRNSIIIIYDSQHYEIKGPQSFCAWKYLLLYRLLNNKTATLT